MTKRICLPLLLAVLIPLLLACGGNPQSGGSRKSARPGDTVILRHDGDEVWLGTTEENNSELIRRCSRRDEVGVRQMFAQGRVFAVPAGTKATLTQPGLLTAAVRIQEGPHAGVEGFLEAEWVHAEESVSHSPPTSQQPTTPPTAAPPSTTRILPPSFRPPPTR